MDKDKIKKGNELLEIIGRLTTLSNILDFSCDNIRVCSPLHQDKLKAIVSSSEHTQMEQMEDSILRIMRLAGKKYVDDLLENKEEEFNKL